MNVISWFNWQPNDVFYLPSIVVAEIRFGLQRMPDGRWIMQMMAKFDYLTPHIFASRILPFARNEAEAYAILRTTCESQGKPMSLADQIAAIAQVNQATLVSSLHGIRGKPTLKQFLAAYSRVLHRLQKTLNCVVLFFGKE